MKSTRSLFPLIAALALSLFAGCGKRPADPVAAAPSAVEAGVITLEPQAVTLTRELPGRTSAFRVAEVRARVSGVVLRRLFEEGSEVAAGQPLYQIDPAPYEAALDSARATLARAEAEHASAKLLADRYQNLIEARAVSQQEYDDARADLLRAAADVAAAEAAVRTASINLEYTKVLAPIAGRIGRSEVTEGAYVQSGAATLLATIQQIDRLYVDINQASAELLQLQQAYARGELQRAGATTVRLLRDDGSEYPQAGELQFADITVNPSTGSLRLRAVVPNPNRELLPGLFVRARVEEGTDPAALLVPQQGVTRNQRGQPTALVVDANGQAEVRVLATSRTIGSHWLVTAGLSAGDQVIVQNLQKIRPGAPVKPVPATGIASAAAQ